MPEHSDNNNDNTKSTVVLNRGTMVSQYRIVEKIGAGGMGEVYLAEDTDLDRLWVTPIQGSHRRSGQSHKGNVGEVW